jgi:hypothetical protein
MTTTMSGRRWAYIGACLGGTVSIAANIAHSYVPPEGVTEQGWSPHFGAVIGAVFWPVALFVATEILTRVAWPSGRVWWLLRWAGMLPVAFVAALVSYRHLSGLLAFYGEEPIVCVLGPLAVDGLMVMATGAILATGQHRHTTDPLTVPAVADIVVRPAPNPSAVPAPAGPATPKPRPSTDAGTETPAPPAARPEIPTPAVVAARITKPPAPAPTGSATASRLATRTTQRPRITGPRTPASELAPSAPDSSITEPDAAQLTLPVVSPDLLNRARQVARQYRTEHGTPITAGQLAVRLKVTSEEATQALAVLDLASDNPTRPVPTVNGNRPKAAR